MGIRKSGNMGRGSKIILWAIRIALCVASTRAAADVQYATVLPSQVKHVRQQKRAPKSKKHKARTAAPSRRASRAMAANEFAPELREEAAANPSASKYFSRTVFYYRSSEPLPEDYSCDSDKEAQKLAEAEAQAQSKCEQATSGGESCRLAKSVIAKTGVLQCSDFPGHRCPGSGHYRGCVAEALVLGEKGARAEDGQVAAGDIATRPW